MIRILVKTVRVEGAVEPEEEQVNEIQAIIEEALEACEEEIEALMGGTPVTITLGDYA